MVGVYRLSHTLGFKDLAALNCIVRMVQRKVPVDVQRAQYELEQLRLGLKLNQASTSDWKTPQPDISTAFVNRGMEFV